MWHEFILTVISWNEVTFGIVYSLAWTLFFVSPVLAGLAFNFLREESERSLSRIVAGAVFAASVAYWVPHLCLVAAASIRETVADLQEAGDHQRAEKILSLVNEGDVGGALDEVEKAQKW